MIAHIISSNLPIGFDMYENTEEYYENNKMNIKLAYELINNKPQLKKDKDVPAVISEINILATEDKEFKVGVSLGDKMHSDFKEAEFYIPNFYRIYKIIAWINTNLHYNE